MPRTPSVAEIASLSRDAWERVCRALAVEIFQAEGIEDRLGQGNGLDAIRVEPKAVLGWQFRRYDDRLGQAQASKIKTSLKLAHERAQSEDKLPLVCYEVWANIDLQPGHMSVKGERERVAEIRSYADSLGVQFRFRGVTWVHTKLMRHPFLAPELFEDVPAQISELAKQTVVTGADVRQILAIIQTSGENPVVKRLAEQARVHYDRGIEEGNRESFSRALGCLTDAHNLVRGLAVDSKLQGLILVARAGVQTMLGDLVSAERDARDALTLLPAEEELARAYAIGNGAIATGLRGGLAAAAAAHKKALAVFESIGDEAGILQSLSHIVEAELAAGNVLSPTCRAFVRRLKAAASAFERGVGPSDLSFAAKGVVGKVLMAFGIETKNNAILLDAAELFRELSAVAEECGWKYLLLGALSNRAEALRYLNLFEDAVAVHSQVEALASTTGFPKSAADAKYNIAIVLSEQGHTEAACAKMREAEAAFKRIGDVDSAQDARKSTDRWTAMAR